MQSSKYKRMIPSWNIKAGARGGGNSGRSDQITSLDGRRWERVRNGPSSTGTSDSRAHDWGARNPDSHVTKDGRSGAGNPARGHSAAGRRQALTNVRETEPKCMAKRRWVIGSHCIHQDCHRQPHLRWRCPLRDTPATRSSEFNSAPNVRKLVNQVTSCRQNQHSWHRDGALHPPRWSHQRHSISSSIAGRTLISPHVTRCFVGCQFHPLSHCCLPISLFSISSSTGVVADLVVCHFVFSRSYRLVLRRSPSLSLSIRRSHKDSVIRQHTLARSSCLSHRHRIRPYADLAADRPLPTAGPPTGCQDGRCAGIPLREGPCRPLAIRALIPGDALNPEVERLS
jgi:hypothetical protein